MADNETAEALELIELDALIIGAGFGGLRMIHELRTLGLSYKVVEAGSDVGGTWYWNRYPGARTDSESFTYAFSFSKEIMDEWDWAELMPKGEHVHAYLKFVADRLDMRKDITFNRRIETAHYDAAANRWLVQDDSGARYRCTYLISAVGLLTVPYLPPFKGLDSFKGTWLNSSRWPEEGLDLRGKRVAIVGTGSTGIQMLPAIAPLAAQVTMFQRTANYVIPTRNHPLEDYHRHEVRANYDEIWSKVRQQVFAFAMDPAGRTYDSVTGEERERIFEAGWEAGGFRYIFETFDDILVDERSNDAASDFIRRKIRSIVKDPTTAELLCPTHGLLSKRPALCNHYYETFNRKNVSLVDVSSDPIERITPNGIVVAGNEYEFDVIIFATGFDAGTGALMQIDVQGLGGRTIQEHWKYGPRTNLGTTIDGFPNLFMISGPQSPFSNIPPVIHHGAAWVGRAIAYAREHGEYLETTREAATAWGEYVQALVDYTLLGRGASVHSWFLGANIPDKPRAVLFYFGGAGRYFDELEASADQGFPGFTTARVQQSQAA